MMPERTEGSLEFDELKLYNEGAEDDLDSDFRLK
jgi:hypothetical protein